MTQPADAQPNAAADFFPPAEARQPAEPSNDGQALLRALQAKTKFDPSAPAPKVEPRPGWEVTIAGAMLPEASWTAEQRSKGVKLGFNFLNLKEHRRAEGGLARRLHQIGMSPAMVAAASYEEKCIVAFATVDDVPVNDEQDAREALWERLGTATQAFLVDLYADAEGFDSDSIKRLDAARAAAAKTFRVRGLRRPLRFPQVRP